MKIAICARGEGLTAEVDPRFGRCSYFVLVDAEKGTVIETVSNTSVGLSGGAGPQSAQLLANKGVQAVLVGNIGPNADAALKAAKIAVYGGIEGTVEDTLQKFKAGSLNKISGATVAPHSGM